MMHGAKLIPKHLFVPAHYIIDSKHRHIHKGKINILILFFYIIL